MKEVFQRKNGLKKLIFIAAALFCLSPFVSSSVALVLGCTIAQMNILPYEKYNGTLIKFLLQAAVVGLGFGMNAMAALKAGSEGLIFTICSIFLTLAFGILLGKRMKIKPNTTLLIAAGTAICGGSAIAAIAPLVRARKEEISVSLGIVFLLNAAALFIFPWVGHLYHLSQNQFGLWSAIAIHDTSSVVGASGKYGMKAMQIATTIKLERALWIIPVSFLTLLMHKKPLQNKENGAGESGDPKYAVKMPYFILLFLVAMLANTFLPSMQPVGKLILPVAEKMLVLTLFFIGTALSRKALKSVGVRPLLLGIFLWCFISTISFWVILNWIV